MLLDVLYPLKKMFFPFMLLAISVCLMSVSLFWRCHFTLLYAKANNNTCQFICGVFSYITNALLLDVIAFCNYSSAYALEEEHLLFPTHELHFSLSFLQHYPVPQWCGGLWCPLQHLSLGFYTARSSAILFTFLFFYEPLCCCPVWVMYSLIQLGGKGQRCAGTSYDNPPRLGTNVQWKPEDNMLQCSY